MILTYYFSSFVKDEKDFSKPGVSEDDVLKLLFTYKL